MLSEAIIRARLEEFGVLLSEGQISQISTYLDLLLRWNKKINLTSVVDPKEIVTRHFGESLGAANLLDLKGRLLDVGSGAGFPGLALKIPFPGLSVTLLEPVAKKRAFLKEAARVCGMTGVEVRAERLEQFASDAENAAFDVITARAVGNLEALVPGAVKCLATQGCLCLWLSLDQIAQVRSLKTSVKWAEPHLLPFSSKRGILVGTRY
jgi:16S rRNA (guanine527-N7)-methyltransferase